MVVTLRRNTIQYRYASWYMRTYTCIPSISKRCIPRVRSKPWAQEEWVLTSVLEMWWISMISLISISFVTFIADMGTLKLVQLLLKLTKAVWGKDKPWVWRHRTSFPVLRWHKLEVKCCQVLHCPDWLQAFFTDLQLWLKSETNGWRRIFAACTCTKKLCHLGVWLQVAFDASHPSCFEPGFPLRDKFLITCFS